MMTKSERAATYRKAARLLERRHTTAYHCCEALDVSGAEENECRRMKSVYAPKGDRTAWMSLCDYRDHVVYDERAVRILALCFMAAMVETGDA